ncbi:hypothetical protein M758_6G159200 [Ceratodon purpureus]|uniref:Nudix hydrolase domain-containing protein n=1 Tax=Ceratodon purpureus TaxID=3225 RepID=A0A8T0HHZ8_CERPU|nr:hypothetical protein KC19_6G165600 [Ceratodon purpureus]KAG0614214.1 hypothetical protein M758_6G159200 [Ceratodon purpureus]
MAGTMIARTASGPPQRTQLPSQELLDDLCSRFVLNVPEEELQAFERILFSVEQAHWFYEDNAMEQNMALKSLTLREFTSLMFQSCTALRPYIMHIDDIYKDFTTYKTRVPVMGAIILDETLERCLLVKGWKAGASWSFPRGKKNKGEEDHCCASREVMEETGYDVHPKLKLEDHLEVVMGQQRMRLYIIPGVKDDTSFAPQTKKEVSEIAWHRVDELPVASTDSVVHHRGPTGLKYFMVFPFVTPLKSWIAKKRGQYPKRAIPLPGVTIWKVKNNLSSGGSGPLSQNYVNAVMPAVPAAVAAPVPSSEKIRSSPRGSPKQSPKVSPKQSPRNSPRVTPRVVSKTPPLPQTPPKSVLKGPPGNAFRNFRFDFATILQQLDG